VSRRTRSGGAEHDRVHVRAIMDALRRIVRALRISARAAEGRLGISGAQLFVLHQLADRDASSIDELAARTLTHQSSVSVVVSRLAARGLVVRRTVADDARRTGIALTATGRAVLRSAPEAGQARLITGLQRLSPEQRRALAFDLTALVRALEVSDETPAMFFEDESAGARKGQRTRPAAGRRSRSA
jgi:MarR family transcriptional regulator, lower aerobic nicotinate degradation pathway regulator